MCDHNDGLPLSFPQLVSFLQEPPFEPCQSELEFLSPAAYDAYFTEIIRIYRRPIIYHIAHILEDYDSAKDLAQDVFTNLYKARISFDKAYIYRAAKNAAYSELHRLKRQSRVLHAFWKGVSRQNKCGKSEEFDALDTQPLPDAELIERARNDAVRRATSRLPEHFRAPLALLAEGKNYEEITKITRTNKGTVKSRICRGKSILRRKLHAYLEGRSVSASGSGL